MPFGLHLLKPKSAESVFVDGFYVKSYSRFLKFTDK